MPDASRVAAILVAATLLPALPASAGQPIFSEMPRWSGGWGVQFIYEHRTESALLEADETLSSLTERVSLLHVEGVYTWDKSIRATVKMPVVLDAVRDVPSADGGSLRQTDSGLGNPTVALPLKRYFNLDGRSGSWTLAPQVKLPLAADDDYMVYSDGFGLGGSVGYETETWRYLLGASLAGFHHPQGEDDVSLNLSAGLNFSALGSWGHIKLKTHVGVESDGSLTVRVGPTLYWRFTDLVHGQLEWKHDLYDRQGTVDHGNGDALRAGVGFVF